METQTYTDELLSLGKLIVAKDLAVGDAPIHVKEASMALLNLKLLNRDRHIRLENVRLALEAKKSKVEMLQLKYENLLYKKSHLHREIKTCKDLNTPYLNEVESELGVQFGTTIFSEGLTAIHERTIAALHAESKFRTATIENFNSLQQQQVHAIETLDKKRKFLDDFPAKITSIAQSLSEFQSQIQIIESVAM